MRDLVEALFAIQAAALAALLVTTFRAWRRLPPRIPTRWGGDTGDVTYGPRGFILVLPCIAVAFSVALVRSADAGPARGPAYAVPLAGIAFLLILIVAQRVLISGPRR
ncbi:MAG TPA: hypothetical protein VFB22_13985 [Candidatus Baltobacteraceae bacterium]|nr:hypothetical protein [Candidatus Baltobacteraceae bacterium]